MILEPIVPSRRDKSPIKWDDSTSSLVSTSISRVPSNQPSARLSNVILS